MKYIKNAMQLNMKEAGKKAEFGIDNSVSFSVLGKRFHFCKKD